MDTAEEDTRNRASRAENERDAHGRMVDNLPTTP